MSQLVRSPPESSSCDSQALFYDVPTNVPGRAQVCFASLVRESSTALTPLLCPAGGDELFSPGVDESWGCVQVVCELGTGLCLLLLEWPLGPEL